MGLKVYGTEEDARVAHALDIEDDACNWVT